MTRVLVVDDDDILSELVAFTLERRGFEVQVSEDGEQALEVVASWKPEVVVLDQMLPGIDGIEVLRKLKEDPATDDVKVVMLTARSREQDIVRALEGGADDYVVKPFMPEVLAARIRKTLAGHAA